MVKVAIVCEGKGDKEFFDKLAIHLGFDVTKLFSFYIFGGKSFVLDATHKKYKDLKDEIDNDQIDKILFVVDSDSEKSDPTHNGYENTQIALNAIIERLGFTAISHTYIMCDPITKKGYLESLILSTISEKQKNCIECFLVCSEFESKENHKAILNHIYKLAYPKAPYDFKHENFDELKQVLKNLFADIAEDF